MSKGNYNFGNRTQQEKTGYALSRRIYTFSENNPGLVKPKHFAVYFWIVELTNRLRWKEIIGVPTMEAMKNVGIKDRRVYRQVIIDLERWGFIKVITKSINQSRACQIQLLLKEDYDHKWNTEQIENNNKQRNTEQYFNSEELCGTSSVSY